MATNADDESVKDDESTDVQDENLNDDDQTTNDDVADDSADDSEGESEDQGQTEDDAADGSGEEKPSTFNKGEGFEWVKGDTPEEAFENMKEAYRNSSKEALKWKKLASNKQGQPADADADQEDTDSTELSPILRQAERREVDAMNREYDSFLERFPQGNEPGNAEKLEKRVQSISKAIQADEDREPTFAETLNLAAASFGWKPISNVAGAVKDSAASAPRAGVPTPPPKSKVTPAQIKAAKRFGWAQDMTDGEIRKELEKNLE